MFPPDKTKSEPRDALAAMIEQLGEPDASVRARAASEIFTLARERTLRCTNAWLRDAELGVLFVRESSGVELPRITVGVAVRPGTFARIREANGSPMLAEIPADLDAIEFELHFAGGVRLDLLTTRDEGADGAIARFLRKSGEGIQQVELDVRNVDQAEGLLGSRFRLAAIYPAARAGANGTRVNFFLASDPDGGKLLIELVEMP
jgi:hypothetical protein